MYKKIGKHFPFWLSLIVMIIVVSYSTIEWFDHRIPFSPVLYVLSGLTIVTFLLNLYYFVKR